MLKFFKKITLISKANALVKAYLQEQKAARSLEYYRKHAREKGITPLGRDGIRQALSSRLKNRNALKNRKTKGQLHIFLPYYISNWQAVLAPSLKPFGKVTEFNWREKGYMDSSSNWLNFRDKMNEEMLEVFFKANNIQPVDIVIGYLSGYTVSPQTLEKMSEAGAVIVNFCWDDKLAFPGRIAGGRFVSPAAIASKIDLNLTNSPDSIIKYAIHGGLSMFWPEAAYPKVHRPYDIPFEFDVSFVGSCYGWRPDFIDKLARNGVKVECFGRGWSNGNLSDEEMVKLYSRSRINLGFSGVGYSKKLMCLKGRDFEVPASNGLYLTQNNPELSLVFEIGKEILTYKDEEDCAMTIKKMLSDPQTAASIRKAGMKRCLRDHSYEARWTDLFTTLGILSNERT